jgi:hypothetical protein
MTFPKTEQLFLMGPAELRPTTLTDIQFPETSCYFVLFWSTRRWKKPIGQAVLKQMNTFAGGTLFILHFVIP